MTRPQYPLILLASLLALLASCSKPGSAVIGTWSSNSQFEYGSERSEFFKDGACFIETQGQRITGAWSALDDGRLRVTMTLGGGPALTMFATITGDELILDAGTNRRTAYVREQSQRATEIKAAVQKSISEREIRIEAEKRAVAERQAAEDRQRERQREAERLADERERAAERLKRQQQDEAEAVNHMAWELATSRDPQKRDGRKAVELALQAVKIAPDNYECLDTLAAAYARNGDFDNAVATQKRVLSLNSSRSGANRLVLYQQKKPYED